MASVFLLPAITKATILPLKAIGRFGRAYAGKIKDAYKEYKIALKTPINTTTDFDSVKVTLKARKDTSLIISEIVGTLMFAPAVGLITQYATGNAYKGIAGVIAGDYFPAVFSFQLAWYSLNKSYYSTPDTRTFGRIRKFYRDVLPMHVVYALAGALTYAVTAGGSSLIIAGLNSTSENLGHRFPTTLAAEAINVGVAETIYLWASMKFSRWFSFAVRNDERIAHNHLEWVKSSDTE